VLIAIVVSMAVSKAECRQLLTARSAIIWLVVSGTVFGLIRVATPRPGQSMHLCVPSLFILEAIATLALLSFIRQMPKREV